MNDTLKIRIRPLRPDDITAVMQLHRELAWNPAFKADGSTLKQRLEELAAEESALLLVAEAGERVVGYIHGEIVTYLLFAGREMLVSELFVMASARGQGVGTALLLLWVSIKIKGGGRRAGSPPCAWPDVAIHTRQTARRTRATTMAERSRITVQVQEASLWLLILSRKSQLIEMT